MRGPNTLTSNSLDQVCQLIMVIDSMLMMILTGVAYILNVLSWACDVLIIFGVVTTGISADAGHAWAAGNRAYRPIDDA